jgi:hypothetical protein
MKNRKYLNVVGQLLIVALISLLIACGSSNEVANNGGGELIGTGFIGTSATGAPIAQADITVRDISGEKVTTTTDANGSFSSEELAGTGPFLLRVTLTNGESLYSIGHKRTTVDEQLRVNIHPYTDLIVRNWFKLQGEDIDSEFEAAGALDELPSLAEINAIKNEVTAIVAQVLIENNVPLDFDFISSAFDANHVGFDAFLDNSQIIINNTFINITINQSVTNIQNIIVNNINLATDFTENNNTAPSVPTEVRALAASQSEVVIIWQASVDDLGVSSYKVYRNGEFIGETAFTSFIDAGLSTSTNYSYEVEAFDSKGLSSGTSSATLAITLDVLDVTSPPAAANLSVVESDDVLDLSWDQSDINDVAGFKILRGSAGDVSEVLAVVTATQFIDFNAMSGTHYCYKVITFDAADNESAATDDFCITTAGGNETLSFLGLSASVYEVDESSTSIAIEVNRGGSSSEVVSVDYTVSGLSASAESDFASAAGTLTWQATDTSSKTILVQILQDDEVESNETVSVELLNPSINSIFGVYSSAILTIYDAVPVACVELVETDITEDTTLALPCYEVNSNISVRDAATLVIEPGVQLKFAAGMGLTVDDDGVLSAIGTVASPILFTGELAAPGYWDGIEIRSIAPSVLDHTIVEYGGHSSSYNEANIGLSFGGKASIENSIIRYSENYGIKLDEGETLTAFNNNTLTLNEKSPVYINANNVGMLQSDSHYSGNTDDFIEIVGDLDDSQTWHLLDVDYHMPTNYFNVEAKLIIKAGVTLVFPAGALLAVNDSGILKAIGTALQPITFTGLEQSAGYWSGIQFTFNNNANEMDHTIVEYGGGPGGNSDANVGVFGVDGNLTLTNSILRYSGGYGFNFYHNITLIMDNITVVDNAQSGAIYFNDIGKLSKNSVYTGNTDDWIDVSNSVNSKITTNQTVKNIGVPYVIKGGNRTNVEAALSFEPGTELQFSANGGFLVASNASLTAQGTAEEPITFTGTQKVKGYWNGIQYTFSDSEANIIDHAIVEYAGADSGNTKALVGFFSTPTHGQITNTVLRGSSTHGIWLDSTTTGDFSTGNTFIDIDGDDTFIDP